MIYPRRQTAREGSWEEWTFKNVFQCSVLNQFLLMAHVHQRGIARRAEFRTVENSEN